MYDKNQYLIEKPIFIEGPWFCIVPEFEVLFKQEETYDPSKYMFDFAAGNCYDHIWVAALALNCTDAYLKEIGEYFDWRRGYKTFFNAQLN